MATAKCLKCGGSAIADTFEQARKLINHAVGLSRGIKCGNNYNKVVEIKPKESPETKISIPAKKDTNEKTISEKPKTEIKKETSEKTIVPTKVTTESSKKSSKKVEE